MNPPVVAVALSGGIDSLVTGYLLKKKYPCIFGIHFTTGYEIHPVDLTLLQEQLGFPVHQVDLSADFEAKVVNYLVSTYLQGETPNPCLACNREIKFGLLLDHAKDLGAEFLATGHYATVINSQTRPGTKDSDVHLKKGIDPRKDQSYFLSMLSRNQLAQVIFPLAGMEKTRVRALAKEAGIRPLHPSESQDICFIHDNNFAGFIHRKTQIKPEPGNIVDMDGQKIGTHTGLHRFTVGQRRGINCPAPQPYYVKKIDTASNQLIVCFKADLPEPGMVVGSLVWNSSRTGRLDDIVTKIRYNHPGALSKLSIDLDQGLAHVQFETPQNAVTPGQGAVFYEDDRVLGAGIIQ